jgi:endoribonuclease Dicer
LKVGQIPDSDSDQPEMLAAVMVHGHCIGDAIGTSSRYAKVRASEKAIEAIKMLLPVDFRLKYGCDCQLSDTNTEETKMKAQSLLDLQSDQKGSRMRAS